MICFAKSNKGLMQCLGPCVYIKPHFVRFSDQFPNISFASLDVDEVPAVAQQFQVTRFPNFLFWKRGRLVDRFLGSDDSGLRDAIATFSGGE